jgi:hypothetical protein
MHPARRQTIARTIVCMSAPEWFDHPPSPWARPSPGTASRQPVTLRWARELWARGGRLVEPPGIPGGSAQLSWMSARVRCRLPRLMPTRPRPWSQAPSGWRSSPQAGRGDADPFGSGVQVTSWVFSQRAKASGLVPSMGGVGVCYNNAMIESSWSWMQVEPLDQHRWWTRLELANAIFEVLGDLLPAPRPRPRDAQPSPAQNRQPPPWHEESSSPAPRNQGQLSLQATGAVPVIDVLPRGRPVGSPGNPQIGRSRRVWHAP